MAKRINDEEIILALLTSPTLEMAARQCRLSVRQLYERRQDPAFVAKLKKHRPKRWKVPQDFCSPQPVQQPVFWRKLQNPPADRHKCVFQPPEQFWSRQRNSRKLWTYKAAWTPWNGSFREVMT